MARTKGTAAAPRKNLGELDPALQSFCKDAEANAILCSPDGASYVLYCRPTKTTRIELVRIFARDESKARTVAFGYVEASYIKNGIKPELARKYIKSVAELIDNARLARSTDEPILSQRTRIKVGDRQIRLREIMPHRDGWLNATIRAVEQIREHLS